MAKFIKYFQRNSLITKLVVVVALLAGLALFAALSGWRLLQNVGETQHQIASRNIPLVTAAHTLATQAASIASIAQPLPAIDQQAILDKLYLQLDRQLSSMETIPGRIQAIDPAEAKQLNLAQLVSGIRTRFDNIRQLVDKKLQITAARDMAAGRIDAEIAELERLLERSAATQANTIFAQTETLQTDASAAIDREALDRLARINLNNEILYHLVQRAIELDGLAQSLIANPTSVQVRDIKSRIDFQVRLMVSDSVGLPNDAMKKSLSQQLDKIFTLVIAPTNLAQLQLELNGISLELSEKYSFLQDALRRLNQSTQGLVDRLDLEVREVTREADLAAQRGARTLLAIAAMSLLISLLVIWVFIVKRVIVPLRELADAMHQVSNYRLAIKIPRYAEIELNEIACALQVFSDNSQALAEYRRMIEDNNQRLTRVNEDLNAFVHVASHDLKSPLHGINLLAQFIVDDLHNDSVESAVSNLELLQQRIRRSENLIDSLLRYTRAEAPEDAAKLDVSNLSQDAFDMVCQGREFDLRLPAESTDCVAVESDLNLVFMNLFDNAMRHHDRDRGVIELRYGTTANQYVFEVSDDGPGIAPEYHQSIFEVFKTLRAKDEVEGSGVGLAHVRRLLESRNGSIQVVSNPEIERGARFVVQYPRPVNAHG